MNYTNEAETIDWLSFLVQICPHKRVSMNLNCNTEINVQSVNYNHQICIRGWGGG